MIIDKKTSERLLKDLRRPTADRAWALLSQFIVDKLFENCGRKLTGIKTLDDSQVPCCPGAVLLVRERSLKDWFLRHEKPAVVGAQLPDFYDERALIALRDVACLRQRKAQPLIDRIRFIFQTENQLKEVKIELNNLERNSVKTINSDVVKVDLDNFTNTGFRDDYFYIVKDTLTAERIRIIVKVAGRTESFDEHVSRTIAFAAEKVKLTVHGRIKKTKPIRTRLPVRILFRKNYELLINNLLPNQTRFGGAVGDFKDFEDEHIPYSPLRRIQRLRQLEEDRQLLRGLYAITVN